MYLCSSFIYLIMIDVLIIVVAIMACVVTYMYATNKGKRELAKLESVNEVLQSRLEFAHASHQQQLEEQEKRHSDEMMFQQQMMTDQMKLFQNQLQLRTQEMLKERQQELQQKNDEQMEAIIRPLKEQIAGLNEQLNKNREDGAAKDARLNEMLSGFVKQASEMGSATDKLAAAMMSNGKVHGDWGEQTLERILESCGMQRGINYLVQASSQDEEGREQRPDVYILCPKDRRIVIDSKVSLTAYANYLSALTPEQAKQAEEENYRSVKAQVDRLASKAYNKLDKDNFRTVLMFIPNEGAYILAMRHNPDLGQYAYDKGVVVLTPTNLMLTLQLIEGMWQKENEEQNIQNILSTAGSLFEKFVAFSDKLSVIKKSLESADRALDDATSYLTDGKGNIVRQVERLSEFGAKYNKSKKINAILAPSDDDPDA